MKNYYIIFTLFIIICITFCTGNKDDENNKITINANDINIIKLSDECKTVTKEFDGEIIENLIGKLIVTGNEPFIQLKFVVDKPAEENDNTNDAANNTNNTTNNNETSNDTQKEEQPEVYSIVKPCSKDLWNLQEMKLKISGKVKETILETIIGQKMRVLTLYPIIVEKIIE